MLSGVGQVHGKHGPAGSSAPRPIVIVRFGFGFDESTLYPGTHRVADCVSKFCVAGETERFDSAIAIAIGAVGQQFGDGHRPARSHRTGHSAGITLRLWFG